MSVVAFPSRPGPPTAATLAAAVDRYLDSIPTAATRASYGDTLARLIDDQITLTTQRRRERCAGPGCDRGLGHARPMPSVAAYDDLLQRRDDVVITPATSLDPVYEMFQQVSALGGGDGYSVGSADNSAWSVRPSLLGCVAFASDLHR